MRPTKIIATVAAAATLAAVLVFALGAGPGVISRPFALRGQGAPVGPVRPAALGQSGSQPIVSRDRGHSLSRPLRRIEPLPAPPHWQPSGSEGEVEDLRPVVERAAEAGAAGGGTDPVWQESVPSTRMPSPTVSFDGIAQAQQEALGYWALPPDANGDIGPNHYVEMVNTSLAVFDRSGATLLGPVPVATLWTGAGGTCETRNDGDPVVVYDEAADRWLVSQFSLGSGRQGPFYECVAISQTGDPTGAWYRYAFLIHNSKMNDYPKFGVWPDGYYLAVNQFNGYQWAGQRVVVFDRSAMLGGNSAQQIAFDLYSVDPNLGAMLPADLDGAAPPPGAPALFAQFDDDGWGYPKDQLELWAFHADWTTPANSTFSHLDDVPVAAADTNLCSWANCIPQPGGSSPKLDPMSDRLMWRLQYRNFGSYQTLVTSHTVDVNGNDRAGVRWYELRDDGTGWKVDQEGTFSPDATNRWMPSAAMNATGDLAVGYSVSSGSVSPGIRYAGRLAGDPAGVLSQGENILKAGGGSQGDASGRWGDYSSLSVDPVDGCTFWYTNEYYASNGSDSWRTRVGAFRLPGCGPPAPPDLTPPTNVEVEPFVSLLALAPRRVAWSASDGGSGVATYDVLLRQAPWNGDFGPPTTWQDDTSAISATFDGSPGTTACFAATATDQAANTSAPSAEECLAVPVDDPTAVASGPWARRSAAGHFLDTYSQASNKGATLTLDGVQASRLWVVADKCRTCGQIDVRWNGSRAAHLRLHAFRTKRSVVFPVASLGSVELGTLQIRVTTKGMPVRIDGIGISR